MPVELRPLPGARAREAGSVTILALWSVAIVALLLAAATAATRSEVRAARNAIGESQARLAAVAGTQLGLARLLRGRVDETHVFDGTPEIWRDGAVPVEIAIIDEAGKVDLNEAPLALLTGLLVAVGQQRNQAERLACGILEWRGARAPACSTPSERRLFNRSFAAIEQLVEIPGFGETIYDAVADYVTVATGASTIDPLVAPRPVLLALPGADTAMVDALLAARAQWHIAVPESGLMSLHTEGLTMPTVGTVFTIRAIAATTGARYRADLQVRLNHQPPAEHYEVIAARAPPVDRGRVMAAHRGAP